MQPEKKMLCVGFRSAHNVRSLAKKQTIKVIKQPCLLLSSAEWFFPIDMLPQLGYWKHRLSTHRISETTCSNLMWSKINRREDSTTTTIERGIREWLAGSAQAWNVIVNWKHFWFVLPLKRHSLLAPLPRYKQFPARFASPFPMGLAAWPGSTAGSSLPITLLPRGPSSQQGRWKHPTFPPLSFRRWPWTLLLPGEAAETCCYLVKHLWDASSPAYKFEAPLLMFAVLPPAWLALTTATETGLFLPKYLFFFFKLKPWAVTGCENHSCDLWMLAKDYTFLWL